MFETPDIDLIKTEYELDGKKNGLEFISHVKNSVPNPPPIIMVSNQSSESVAVDCIKFCVIEYIAKDRGWYKHLPLRIVHTLVHKQVLEDNKELKNIRDTVFDQMFDSVAVLDKQGSILLWNENFTTLTGLSKEEVISNPKLKLDTLFENKAQSEHLLSQVNQGLIIKNFKTSIINKDKQVIPVSISGEYMYSVNKIVTVLANLQQKKYMIKNFNELKKYSISKIIIK